MILAPYNSKYRANLTYLICSLAICHSTNCTQNGETWYVHDSGGPKLAAWLQTKHIDRYIKLLLSEQNGFILTSKSITATMAIRPQIHLRCKPQNIWGQIASQKVYMLAVMKNKDQNQKKSGMIRHVVKQTHKMTNASRIWLSLKYGMMFQTMVQQ